MATRLFPVFAVAAAGALMTPAQGDAASIKTLFAFPNPTPTPFMPYSSLVKLGSLYYGTTVYGGPAGRGTVFSVDPVSGATVVVHAFSGQDGAFPFAGLLSHGGELYGTTYQGGADGLGAVFAIDPANDSETTLHSFTGPDGKNPQCTPVALAGKLYCTTAFGGAAGLGTIIGIDIVSGAQSALYSFAGGNDGATSYAGLLNVKGILYGTTSGGGGAGDGTIFTFDPGTGAEAAVYAFQGNTDGGFPVAPLIDVDGTLFGTTEGGGGQTAGTVYRFTPASGQETVVHAFSANTPAQGLEPDAPLLSDHGTLYGTTLAGGAHVYGSVFSVSPDTGEETVLKSFDGQSGSNPAAGLVMESGKLLGTTSGASTYEAGPHTGGPAALPGTIFSIHPKGQGFKLLASLPGINPVHTALSGVTDAGGMLYGTTAQGGAGGDSGVFSVDAGTGAESLLADLGAANLTSAKLTPGAGVLYGTTRTGGTAGDGSVYSVDPATGAVNTIYSFTNGNDGAAPDAALLNVGGILYGTASQGGASFGGTVFSVDPSSGTEATLYGFTFGNDGGDPASSLIEQDGLLYGTAMFGGGQFYGTVFSVNSKSGAENPLYSFNGGAPGGTDGEYPQAGPVALGGMLYGTTPYGGINPAICPGLGCGIVYAVDRKTGIETVVHEFTGGADGNFPIGGLVVLKGKLYGAASAGGAFGYGTLFSIEPKSGALTVLYSFAGLGDGAGPQSTLTASGGVIYGTTNSGGQGNAGTVFSLVP